MKRTLSLVLALVMVLGTFTGVFAAEVDVKTAADFLEDEGILLGANGDLMLENNLERRDAVILLSRLLGVEDEAAEFLTTEDSPSWEDARNDAYYVPFFAWAEENGYFAGDDEGNFNPRNDITAPEFALVLIRALGYEANGHAPWKASLETAEELGLLEGVEVEFADLVVRGEMAIMIVNALNAKINGSDETLAEKLGIEMPVEEVTELTAEVNDTENLAEIVVELSNADLADVERLENASNYRLNDTNIKVKTAKVEGNNVVLTLAGYENSEDRLEDIVRNEANTTMVRNKNYTLTIRGVDRAINKDYDFKAYDNAAPTIESVEALGEYGIKVTTTEPVRKPSERNFLIDGKNVAMVVEQYGRELILTPYYKTKFDTKATELTILEMTDFSGFKSSSLREEIEITTDSEAPEVVSVIRSKDGSVVTVEFDKDVYLNSIGAKESYRNLGNASYEYGRQTIYADTAVKLDTNKVSYQFTNLQRNVDITIEGVENHSGVKMEEVSITPTISLEDEIAEVINNTKRLTINPKTATDGSRYAELVVKFDAKLNQTTAENLANYNIFNQEVRNRFEENHAFIESATYNDSKMEVTLKLTYEAGPYADGSTPAGLRHNNRTNDYDYILEIDGVRDLANNARIALSYVDFEIRDAEVLTVNSVYASRYDRDQEYTQFAIEFSRPVNIGIAENAMNYEIEYAAKKADGTFGTATTKLVSQISGSKVEVALDGYTVYVLVPMKLSNTKYTELTVYRSLESINGTALNASVLFTGDTTVDLELR